MRNQPMTVTERMAVANKWTGVECMLGEHRAVVAGRLNRFATIATLNHSLALAGVEYSWETVERVMESGGRFRV